MQKKADASRSGGPKSGCHGKAASTLSNKRGTSTMPKSLSVSPTSQRVITRTSAKRREAMKALADR